MKRKVKRQLKKTYIVKEPSKGKAKVDEDPFVLQRTSHKYSV